MIQNQQSIIYCIQPGILYGFIIIMTLILVFVIVCVYSHQLVLLNNFRKKLQTSQQCQNCPILFCVMWNTATSISRNTLYRTVVIVKSPYVYAVFNSKSALFYIGIKKKHKPIELVFFSRPLSRRRLRLSVQKSDGDPRGRQITAAREKSAPNQYRLCDPSGRSSN